MPTLPVGASRSQRYRVSAAFLAGAALGCSGGPSDVGVSSGQTTRGGTTANGGATSNSGASPTGSGAGTQVSSGGGATTGTMQGGTNAGGGAPEGTAGNTASTGGVAAAGTSAGGSSAGGATVVGGAGATSMGPGVACAGFNEVHPDSACRTGADCAFEAGLDVYCVAPARPNRGTPNSGSGPGAQECNGSECAGDAECVEENDGVSRCRPTCTTDDDCQQNLRCENGVCTVNLCDEPFSAQCNEGFRCDPTAEGANFVGCVAESCFEGYTCWGPERCQEEGASTPQGCTSVQCTADMDCDCGYCVGGYCAATLGVCQYMPLAMPYGCVWPDEEFV